MFLITTRRSNDFQCNINNKSLKNRIQGGNVKDVLQDTVRSYNFYTYAITI